MLRVVVVATAALISVVTVVGASFYAAYHRRIPEGIGSNGLNGLWLAHHWVGEDHGAADYDRLAESLRAHQISDAFLHVGPIGGDGSIPSERFPNAERLVAELHRRLPGLRVQAWIGQNEVARGGPLDLDDTRARAMIIDTADQFLALGFDGIHYNIEPIFPGDERFLRLLADTHRLTNQRDAVLSVATMELEPFPRVAAIGRRIVSRYHAWTAGYFERVAEHVDQIAVMTYDSAMPTDWLYGAVVRQQTSELARRLDDVTIFVGVPTYDEFNPGHWRAENMATGIRGVRLGLADVDEHQRSRVGMAIYAEWTTDTQEWATYRRDWLRER